MQSFSEKVKAELTQHINPEKDFVDFVGAFIYSGTKALKDNEIVIKIENSNANYIRVIYKMIKFYFPDVKILVHVKKRYYFKKEKSIYGIELYNTNSIFEKLKVKKSIFMKKADIELKHFLKTEEDEFHFLRAAFLSHGTINDPSKKSQYHLEIYHEELPVIKSLQSLLAKHDIIAKITKRHEQHILYINKSDLIADILIMMSARITLFEFEDHRILRDMHRENNRLNNADIANITKQMEAANKQILAINKLEQNSILYNKFTDKTKEVMALRKKYQDVSLAELSELSNGRFSKTNLNYHLKKIIKTAEGI